MKTKLVNINRDNGNQYVYAELRTDESDELLISSTIDDIFEKIFENKLEVINIVQAIDTLLNIGFVSIQCNYAITPLEIKASHYYHQGNITGVENDQFSVIVPIYNNLTNTFTTEKIIINPNQVIQYSI